ECNGYSHFIEHMLFKGTVYRTSLEISESIENVGGQLNAYTSKDSTCFYTKTASNHLERSLDLLSDMFFNSVFDSEEMNRERSVIIEEITMGDDMPDEVCHDLIAEALYGDNSLGQTIIGSKENIEAVTREQLITFMDKHYVAKNVCISIAGNVDVALAQEYVEKYFLVAFNTMRKDTSKDLLAHQPTNSVYKKKIKESEQCYVSIGCEANGLGDLENFPNSVLSNILGGGMSSRLFQALREKQGLCYSVFSYLSAYNNNGYFEIYVGTSPKKVKTAIIALKDEINKLKLEGVTQEELKRGKEQYKGAMLLALENSITVATLYGGYAIRTGELLDIKERIEKTEAVTNEDIMQSINKLLDVNNYSLAYVGKAIRTDLLKLLKTNK
ncbi:MAG: pitrilysin family protein, partial [Clostridia bacterium]